MTGRHLFVIGALAAFVLTTTSSAEAQRDRWKSEATRVSGYFAVQACCEAHIVDRDGDEDTVDVDLDPGLGFGIRAERRVADMFALGGLFELLAWKFDADDDREFFVDIDLFAKVLTEISLQGNMGLELYALIPFGFTAAVVSENDDRESGFGLNMGVLGGAMLLIDKLGIFVEFGFRHHSVWDEIDLGLFGRRDVRLGVTQVAFNIGGSVAF